MSAMTTSVEGLAVFCERQPPEKEYDWCSSYHCAVSQYRKFLGLAAEQWLVSRGPLEVVAYPEPHTFGACAKRARAVLAR